MRRLQKSVGAFRSDIRTSGPDRWPSAQHIKTTSTSLGLELSLRRRLPPLTNKTKGNNTTVPGNRAGHCLIWRIQEVFARLPLHHLDLRTGRCRMVFAVSFLLCGACKQQPIEHTPRTFSFAVLGDAPYRRSQEGPFRRVLRQMNDADLSMVINVGDILWYPCSEALFLNRLAMFQSVRHPLVYTPGDNEWTDCHERLPGSYEPLDRLERLRAIFFEDPTRSLGGNAISLTVQAADAACSSLLKTPGGRKQESCLLPSTSLAVGTDWQTFQAEPIETMRKRYDEPPRQLRGCDPRLRLPIQPRHWAS